MSRTMGKWKDALRRGILAFTMLLAGVLSSRPAGAQAGPPGAVEQFQLWSQFSAIKTISPGWRGYVEIWPRFRTRELGQNASQVDLPDRGFTLQRLFTGLWFVFPFDESNTLRVGARAILNTATRTRSFDETETRFLQEHIGAFPIGDWILSTRNRLEERLVPNRPSASVRYRSRIGVEVPIDSDRQWWFILNNELLVNVNDAGAANLRAGLSENRAIAGFRTRLAPGIGLEFGYQHNWANNDTAFDDVKHCLLVNVAFDIDQIERAGARAQQLAEASEAKVTAAPTPAAVPSALPVTQPTPTAAPSSKSEEAPQARSKNDLLAQTTSRADALLPELNREVAFNPTPIFEGHVIAALPEDQATFQQSQDEVLPEAKAVASRQERRKEDLAFSTLMNMMDGDPVDP